MSDSTAPPPSEAAVPEPPAFAILRSLRRIIQRVSQHSRALSRDVGLTVPQLLCLRAIADAPPDTGRTMVELCGIVHLSPPTVSGVVDRLERSGLVQRVRRTSDRRKIDLVLTEAGRAKAAKLPQPLHERFVARLQGLPPEEIAALTRALERVVELMDAQQLDAAPVLLPGSDAARDVIEI